MVYISTETATLPWRDFRLKLGNGEGWEKTEWTTEMVALGKGLEETSSLCHVTHQNWTWDQSVWEVFLWVLKKIPSFSCQSIVACHLPSSPWRCQDGFVMSELLSQGYHWLEEILDDQSKPKGVAPSLSQREAYILLFVKVSFMAQNIIFLVKYSVCPWEKYVFCYC